MLEKIHQAARVAKILEPGPEAARELQKKITSYGLSFLNDLDVLPAFTPPHQGNEDLQWMRIKEEPSATDKIISLIEQHINTPGINPASGRHFGYVPGGGIYASAWGDYLAALTNRYAGIFFASPGAVRIENELIRWMCGLVGFPATALGNLTTGGSIANLIAINTAREARELKSRDYHRQVLYLTRQTHHCAQKALMIGGMAEAVVRYISMDENFRIQVPQLKAQIKEDRERGLQPFMVVGSAGTTDTGAIDPLDAMATVCQEENLWFHVDAAYGGFFMLVDELKHQFRGIERADSVTIDPHKALFLPYGLGAVLIKDVKSLYRAHAYQANYMQDSFSATEELNPSDASPELSKHFRGLRMWLPLQLYGLRPFRAALEEKVYLCRWFYEQIQKLGFEVGPYPDLSIMIFRYIPEGMDTNAFNEALVSRVWQDGRVFLSSTSIDGQYWIRLAVVSFRTHLEQIKICLEVLTQQLKELRVSPVSETNRDIDPTSD